MLVMEHTPQACIHHLKRSPIQNLSTFCIDLHYYLDKDARILSNMIETRNREMMELALGACELVALQKH